jgi:hypothetical protein
MAENQPTRRRRVHVLENEGDRKMNKHEMTKQMMWTESADERAARLAYDEKANTFLFFGVLMCGMFVLGLLCGAIASGMWSAQ